MVVWTNSHGSFLFGLVVLCAAFAGHCLRFDNWKPRIHGDAWRLSLIAALACWLPGESGRPSHGCHPVDVLLFQPDNTGSVDEWAR